MFQSICSILHLTISVAPVTHRAVPFDSVIKEGMVGSMLNPPQLKPPVDFPARVLAHGECYRRSREDFWQATPPFFSMPMGTGMIYFFYAARALSRPTYRNNHGCGEGDLVKAGGYVLCDTHIRIA